MVNKKWVRVRLSPGNQVESGGTLWFNIGSVDSFERNLENAQMELNIEPPNFIPVVYKSEIEASSLSGLLPTLLIIGILSFCKSLIHLSIHLFHSFRLLEGFLIYMMRRSSEMMGAGGRGGRRGGGLFGGVMDSTAKLINPSEISVQFK